MKEAYKIEEDDSMMIKKLKDVLFLVREIEFDEEPLYDEIFRIFSEAPNTDQN